MSLIILRWIGGGFDIMKDKWYWIHEIVSDILGFLLIIALIWLISRPF